MELLQIIIFSLKLFALTSAIIVLISYFVFKIKDRNREKPFMKSSPDNAHKTGEIIIETKEEEIEQSKTLPYGKRFKILNENALRIPDKKPGTVNSLMPQIIREKISPPQKAMSNNGFNIYDYYSNSSFEPMHKIKL